MKKVNFRNVIFLILFPILSFVIGCFVSFYSGIMRCILFVVGIAFVLATAIYSIRNNKIIDCGTI